ncbi:hypothetical protein DBR28_12550 [Chryseobacterium sp. HMWF028]|nr:hypothetical protein DBR28_12550 [Chryseobacterium sp. HMWF028]
MDADSEHECSSNTGFNGNVIEYIDFRENPGRDKLLHGSASQDCFIIYGKKGSSIFEQDLGIPEEYKFDFSDNTIPLILNKIRDILDNYPLHKYQFLSYKKTVHNEEILFEKIMEKIPQMQDIIFIIEPDLLEYHLLKN